jgi:chorismate mutase
MTIEDWRARIDAIDKQLLELLSQRANYAIEVGKIKNQRNVQVFDPERERQVIQTILRENKGPLGEDALRRIFERVIEECRRVEQS